MGVVSSCTAPKVGDSVVKGRKAGVSTKGKVGEALGAVTFDGDSEGVAVGLAVDGLIVATDGLGLGTDCISVGAGISPASLSISLDGLRVFSDGAPVKLESVWLDSSGRVSALCSASSSPMLDAFVVMEEGASVAFAKVVGASVGAVVLAAKEG